MEHSNNSLISIQLGAKLIDMFKSIVLQGKINVPGHYLLCMQKTGCMTEYFTTAEYFYKKSTSAIEIISRQPNTVDLFQSFELACESMEMLNKT